MENTQKIGEALSAVIRLMLEKPEEMTMNVLISGDTHLFRISASKRDVGILIGKTGRTARSLRVIVGAMAAKAREKVVLDIVVNERL
jgi:predicted RNA-binding protein YlqC (UPF0109 family)